LEGTTGLLELERPARRLEWKRHAGLPELEGTARLLELERSAGLLELKWSAGLPELEGATRLLKLEGTAEEQRTPATARWKAGHVIAGAGEVEGAVVRRPADILLAAVELRTGAGNLGFQTVSHQPGELIHVFLGQTAAHFPDYINCMQGNEPNPLIGFHLHILLIHRQYFSVYFFTINQFDDNVFTLSRL
jgi:hypothetical protein